MNPYELTTYVTAFANIITTRLNENEITILAAILVQLGDTLATIALQKALCEKIRKEL